MDSDPTHVDANDLRAALESLGIGGWNRTKRIEIEAGRITITRMRHTEEGRPFVAADGAATEVTEVAIRSAKRQPDGA